MTIEEPIKALLDAASLPSGSRNFWGTVPETDPTTNRPIAPPYVVLTLPANSPENTLSSGVPINNARVQADCYASTYAAARALADAVNATMTANNFSIMLLEQGPLFEPDVKLHRVVQDYSRWVSR